MNKLRALIITASLLALAGCMSGQGQQSLIGASHNWRRANSVPAGSVGDILRKRTRGHE